MRMRVAVLAGIVALGPGVATAQQSEAAICTAEGASVDDRVAFCRRALESDDLENSQETAVRIALADALGSLGLLSDARRVLTEGIGADPRQIALLLARARLAEDLGDIAAAQQDYATALLRAPGSVEARAARGGMYLRQGEPERALADLSRVVRMRSRWVEPRRDRGRALMMLERHADAETDFSHVIGARPDDPEMFVLRGQARAAQGKADARADFDTAVRMAPEEARYLFERGRYLDTIDDREAANDDFIRARELGYRDVWLEERVREIWG